MAEIARQAVQSCHSCQITALQNCTYTPMVTSEVHPPRTHVYIDICTVGDDGNGVRDALMVRDGASGLYVPYPLLDTTAVTITETLEHG